MAIELFVQPNEPPISWKKFCRVTESHSIAIDGYVKGRSKKQEAGPRVNFNHHEGVNLTEVRATCAQVLLEIRQGLFSLFCDENGNPKANVYANDCDEDVCLSWFLLKYEWMAKHAINPAINRLVTMEDHLDATAGAYPYPPNMPMLQELAWIFEPYRQFRLSGEIDKRNADDFKRVITNVEHRIKDYIMGRAESIPLDLRYDVIGGGTKWVMVKEIGAQARTGMRTDGIQAFVSVRERPDGRRVYVVGRMMRYATFFDVIQICKLCNKEERKRKDRWGGNNYVIGSPRVNGSEIPPDKLAQIIESVVNEKLSEKQ